MGARASYCGGFSCRGAQAPAGAVRGLGTCGSWAQEHKLTSHGALAYLLRCMWNLPRPGIEPVFRIGRRILYH